MSRTPIDQSVPTSRAIASAAGIPSSSPSQGSALPQSATDYAIAPGEYLQEWIEDTDTRAEDAAFRLNLVAEELTLFLAGEYAVTEVLAEDLAKLTDIPAKAWLAYDRHYVADRERLAVAAGGRQAFALSRLVRFVGGKSARLLRAGDTVALQDLSGDATHYGSALIIATTPHDEKDVAVLSNDAGCFVVPGSRLVFTHREK